MVGGLDIDAGYLMLDGGTGKNQGFMGARRMRGMVAVPMQTQQPVAGPG